jgi:hypothetical protein
MQNAVDESVLLAWCDSGPLRERACRIIEARLLNVRMRAARRRAMALGYGHRIRFKGFYRNPHTNTYEYRVVELYKFSKWTQGEVSHFYDFFRTHICERRAAVFIWNGERLRPIE